MAHYHISRVRNANQGNDKVYFVSILPTANVTFIIKINYDFFHH